MRRRSFLAKVWAKLLAHERKHALLTPGKGVLAAVSGGPDSVCLAHYLERRSKDVGFPLALAHVHHGLRGKSADRDVASVKKLAASLGVPYFEARADVRKLARDERRSTEDAARAARYRALAAIAKTERLPRIATGHTLSDHAETIILHLLRGTEPKGLLGIPVKRSLPPTGEVARRADEGAIIRPLRCLSREEVLEYLKFFRLSYRKDETNRDEAFTRNWVRRRVVPLLRTRSPRLEEHLGTMSEKLAQSMPGSF